MFSIVHRFTLDMHSAQSQISIPVMLGDTGRAFRIILASGGKPYVIEDGCLAKLSIKRPTGSRLEAFCTIEGNTTIAYDFSQNENTCAVEGIHECDVTLYGLDGEIITTARFSMVVNDRVINSDDIVLTDTDLTAIDAIVAEEAKRKAAETDRQTAMTNAVMRTEEVVLLANEAVDRVENALGHTEEVTSRAEATINHLEDFMAAGVPTEDHIKEIADNRRNAIINYDWDEEGYEEVEGQGWLKYSTDGGAKWHYVTGERFVLKGITKIRFDWEPDDWCECGVMYGGHWDWEDYTGTYVERNIDIPMDTDIEFETYWAP